METKFRLMKSDSNIYDKSYDKIVNPIGRSLEGKCQPLSRSEDGLTREKIVLVGLEKELVST